jgi:hypothetical protein
MRRATLKLFIVAVGLALAGCTNNPPPSSALPPVSFADQPPFVLNVARIEIVSKYNAPSTPPHIELTMPVTPENAIRRWVQDRIQPRGTQGTLRVVINDATATEANLPKDPNASMFNDEPQSKVDMSVDVTLQLLDDRQFVSAEVSGKASRGDTLRSGLKLNEHDRILYNMVVEVVKAMGDEISPRIKTTFFNQLMIQ